jgi:hypothetical protein
VVALTGCDLTESGREPGGPAGAPRPDPDQELAEQAAAEVAGTLALAAAGAARSRRLARLLRGVLTTHEAHLAALEAPGEDVPAPALPGSSTQVVEQVLRRERLSQRRLAEWSVAADSGQLARLLASMSAAVAQQLVALEQEVSAA